MKQKGGDGSILGVHREILGTVDTIRTELEVTAPEYMWVRQFKFIEKGQDHVVGLYVHASADRAAFEKLFAEFLAEYRFREGT